MAQKSVKDTFGSLLCFYRGQTHVRRSGKALSQKTLGDEIYKKTGLLVSRNKVSNWENDRSYLHPQNDRFLLGAIIEILYQFKGIKLLDEANRLLEAGNYRTLSDEEITKINPEWRKPISTPKEELTSKGEASISTTALRGSDIIPPISLNIEAKEPLLIDVIIHASKFGPGSAPPVPSLIVGRDEDLRRLKENLGVSIADRPKAAIQILTAIKGWPGVGKTTIASALAYDTDIKKAFPDGVLWVSLGQEPNLLSEIATWGRALGTDELLRARTVEEAQAQLAALLRNRRMLLIIDDVWQPEHAIPFKVGGRNCATLITTRRDDVAIALAPSAGDVYRLKVLEEDDALALLKQLAPTVVEGYPNECLVLVQELEGLPLALQVAGRLLNTEANRGFSVVELIDELREGAKLLEAPAPSDRADLVNETTPTIAALLQKSLDRLDDAARDCYAYLGVFAPKPATFDLEAMKFVWQVEDPKPVVGTLVDRGLLEYVPEMERYQMHALLVMLAKSLLTEE